MLDGGSSTREETSPRLASPRRARKGNGLVVKEIKLHQRESSRNRNKPPGETDEARPSRKSKGTSSGNVNARERLSIRRRAGTFNKLSKLLERRRDRPGRKVDVGSVGRRRFGNLQACSILLD